MQTFTGNWTGTGAISGSGDSEVAELDPGEYMESEVVNTGVVDVALFQNLYAAGDNVTLKYRHGATQEDCEAAGWSAYSGQFTSLGYVQVRIEN